MAPSVIEGMDHYTNAADNSLRLAVYSQARKQGMTPQEAAVRARDATIDYQLRARWSKIMAIPLPFYNTAVRTGTRMTQALARSQTMRNVAMGVIAANAMLALWNYLVGGDDDDKKPFIDKVAPWTKELNIVIMNPFDRDSKGRPQPILIPMPYNWAVWSNLGRLVTTAAMGKETWSDMFHSAMKSVSTAFTPLGETGNPFDAVTPEVLRPLAHIMENKTWTNARLHEDERFQKGPNSEVGLAPHQRPGAHRRRLEDDRAGRQHGIGRRPSACRLPGLPPRGLSRDLRSVLWCPEALFAINAGATAGRVMKGEMLNAAQFPLGRVRSTGPTTTPPTAPRRVTGAT